MVTRTFLACAANDSLAKLSGALANWGKGDIASIHWVDSEPNSGGASGWEIFHS